MLRKFDGGFIANTIRIKMFVQTQYTMYFATKFSLLKHLRGQKLLIIKKNSENTLYKLTYYLIYKKLMTYHISYQYYKTDT